MNKPVKHSPGIEAVDSFLIAVEGKAFRMAELATKNTVDAMDVLELAVRHWVRKSATIAQEEWRSQFFIMLCKVIADFERREISRRRRYNPRHESICLEDVVSSDKGVSMMEAGQARLDKEMVTAISHLALPQLQVLLMNAWLGFGHEQIARLSGEPAPIIESRFRSAVMGLHEAFVEDNVEGASEMADEALLSALRRVLNDSARNVSYAHQYQLRQIRLRALKLLQPRPILSWILVTGLMGLCLFVFWWLNLPVTAA